MDSVGPQRDRDVGGEGIVVLHRVMGWKWYRSSDGGNGVSTDEDKMLIVV